MTNVDLAYQHALDHLSRSSFESLNTQDKEIVSIWNWSAAVANGGLPHLYRSKEGNTAFYAPTALRRIGATKTAAIAEAANGAFGVNGPPASKKDRLLILNSILAASEGRWAELESQLDALDEDCDELLDRYLNGAK